MDSDDDYYDDEDVEYIEDDDDDYNTRDDIFDDEATRPQEKLFTVLEPSDILERQRQEIKKVNDVLCMSTAAASLLLRSFGWDVEPLLNTFFASEQGREAVFKKAGLHEKAGSSAELPPEVECQCCFGDVDSNDATALGCGHIFCNMCWTDYVGRKIAGGEAKRIPCMHRGCHLMLDEDVVPSFIDDKLREKYSRTIVNSYVEDNKRMKWCPSVPHCGNAVFCSQFATATTVTCHCGCQWCFFCQNEVHHPASCKMVRAWTTVQKKDGENAAWLSKNTKDCPKCGTPVEKNGGCNLVSCRCGIYFCWICAQQTGFEHTWTEIDGHTCGKYKENFDAENAATKLQRFQHYSDRYRAHVSSMDFEQKAHAQSNLDEYIKKLQEITKDEAIASWDWLSEGITQLRRCRQVLKWSFAWAFYAFNKADELSLKRQDWQTAKNVFEDNQAQLEVYTERLAKALETPLEDVKDNVKQHKTKVVDGTCVATKAREGLLDVVRTQLTDE
eukprot:TRINITY_DN67920_c1_g1_i1.p1 TRINITY_DN67920_c1_g1~~TRINITY_DN67920_c1_g1_i1.p1  ORF type:complete len:500 (-),score=50.15 TRINITY_DN67920_c1_g1_i1:695-2194(-)